MVKLEYQIENISDHGTVAVTLLRDRVWNGTMYLHNVEADFGYNVFRIVEEIDNAGYMPVSPDDNEILNQAYFLFGGV